MYGMISRETKREARSSGTCENGTNNNWIMGNVATALFLRHDIKVNVMLAKQG